MSTLPRISIVVPNYNGGRTIAATLRSLVEQDYPDLEILVADGGSKDDSVEVIRRFQPRLAWWVSEKDKGQSDAINKGLLRATGEVVNWLCSDDRLMPGALRVVGETFARSPQLDVLVGACRIEQDDGSWHRINRPRLESIDLMPCTNPISQPSCFYRRRVLRRQPAIDPSYHFLMDFELWQYFKSQGVRWAAVEDVLSHYILSDANKTTVGGKRIRREWERVYRAYVSDERIPLTFWHNVLLLPLDHVRKRLPPAPARAVYRLRVLAERVLGRFYGFARVHAYDLSWTI